MKDDTKKAISHSLGDPTRDFLKDPLTQDEIMAVIETYSEELIKKPELDLELREIYKVAIEELKKHLVFH